MRVFLLIVLVMAWSVLALWQFHPDLKSVASQAADGQITQGPVDVDGAQDKSQTPVRISQLKRYDDPDYGFSVAIPDGWTRIVAEDSPVMEGDDILESLEPGYAVGFESPRSGIDDRFADYILIEVLPGDDHGLFESTEEQRHYIHSGSERIAYERLEIDSETDSVSEVDLVIFQRGVKAVGYTLGFYAIGEPANEQALFDAFQVLLRTYSQTSDPFVII